MPTTPLGRVRVSSYSRAPTEVERWHYAAMIEQLSDRRQLMQLTQLQLDDMLGVADGLVAKWESFQRLPGAFMLVCWSSALGLSLSAVHHETEANGK